MLTRHPASIRPHRRSSRLTVESCRIPYPLYPFPYRHHALSYTTCYPISYPPSYPIILDSPTHTSEKVCHLSARQRLIDEVGKAAEPIGMGLMESAKADAAAVRKNTKAPASEKKPAGEKKAAAPAADKPADAAAATPAADAAAAPAGEKKAKGEKKEKEPKAKAAPAAVESADNHSMVLFKVGEIVSVEPHPDESVTALWALKIKVDAADEPRSICAGLREHCSKEDLLGRRVIIAANLPPRTLRGVPSNGMVLCACRPKAGAAAGEDGKVPEEVVPIAPPADAPVGSRVTKAGHAYEGEAPDVLNKKQFSRHYEAVAPLLKTNAAGVCQIEDSDMVVEGFGAATGLSDAVVR